LWPISCNCRSLKRRAVDPHAPPPQLYQISEMLAHEAERPLRQREARPSATLS
jgi:hypothetical protein